MRQVQCEKLDPKEIMQALIEVKEGIIRDFLRYRRAHKIAIFKPQLILEINRLTEEQKCDPDVYTDVFETLLETFDRY